MNNDLYKKMKTIIEAKGEFDNAFKTPSKGIHWDRMGYTKNPDGSYTIGKYTVHPDQKPEYPILSSAYKNNVFVVKKLDRISKKVDALALAELAKMGVEWIQFSQLQQIPPEWDRIVSGTQAVGKHGDLGVIFETKVSLRKHSPGYLVWVGPFNNIQNAYYVESTSSDKASLIIKNWIYYFKDE